MATAEVDVPPRRLLRDYLRVFAELGARGELVWVRCGAHRFLVVNEPELVREVLIDRAEQLAKHSQLIEAGRPPKQLPVYGGGIPVALFRAALARGMGPARVPEVLAAVEAAAAPEVARWRDGMALSLVPALQRIAAASAARASFAGRLDAAELDRAVRAIAWADLEHRITSPATRLGERLRLYPQRRRVAAAELTKLGRALIDRADRAERTQLTAVLDELPAFHEPVTRELQDSLVGELLQGAAAPFAQTAAWALVRLASEPEAAGRLREEWAAELPGGQPVTRETLRGLAYTEGFVREVTRFHPTNPRIVRAALAETTVGGKPVPEGTRVVLNVHAIHADRRFYDEPERFAPERWLDGRPNAHKFSYLAFGLGTRRCLGENMAMVGLVGLLPLLARDWDFDVSRLATVEIGRVLPEGRVRLEKRA